MHYLEDPENKDQHEYDLDQENEELGYDLGDDDLSDIDSSDPGPVHQTLLSLLDQNHRRHPNGYPQCSAVSVQYYST